MILYHIDRSNSLKPGQIITSITDFDYCQTLREVCLSEFDGGLSKHGCAYLTTSLPFKNEDFKVSTIYELVFEYVRKQYYPEKPSRFQCFFACDSSGCQKWVDAYFANSNRYPIYKIDVENFIKLDATFISDRIMSMSKMDNVPIDNFPSELSIIKLAYQAYYYWSGKISDDLLFEYLLIPPFKVLSRVQI